ncbi:MAG: hypothetical protein Q7S66_05230 [bacterium]|nr:hypothetical protein [bacterium]
MEAERNINVVTERDNVYPEQSRRIKSVVGDKDMNKLNWLKFIEFWSQFYNDSQNLDEKFYYPNISNEGLLKPDALDELWLWKMGQYYFKIFQKQIKLIKEEKGAILKLRKSNFNHEVLYNFSKRFFPSGLIYQIFLMHICKPEEYPIFDQHVFRAFTFITKKEMAHKPKNIKDYWKYREFVFQIYKEYKISLRDIDKGLMAFGQFLANPSKILKYQCHGH